MGEIVCISAGGGTRDRLNEPVIGVVCQRASAVGEQVPAGVPSLTGPAYGSILIKLGTVERITSGNAVEYCGCAVADDIQIPGQGGMWTIKGAGGRSARQTIVLIVSVGAGSSQAMGGGGRRDITHRVPDVRLRSDQAGCCRVPSHARGAADRVVSVGSSVTVGESQTGAATCIIIGKTKIAQTTTGDVREQAAAIVIYFSASNFRIL